MATVYFAKWILRGNGEILVNGGITVSGDRITSIGPRGKLKRTSKDRNVNLGDILLLPGLINMHTHLEEGLLRGVAREDGESFAAWTGRRRNCVRNSPPDAIISTVRLGIREALANGITTLLDTSQTAISPLVLRDEPVRWWVVHEVHPQTAEADAEVVDDLKKRIRLSRTGENAGIGPYALFSLSPASLRTLNEMSRTLGYLWACHVAESAEELEAFSAQTGELFSHITHSRPWAYGKTERGSMYYAITNNLIPNHGLCLHCNYMSVQELSLLSAKNVSLVLCPQYTALQGHKPFPLEVALNRGINVCLGTETPESAGPMNLFDELHLVKALYPHMPAAQILRLVTANAARALRRPTLGSLDEGKHADIVGVSLPHDPSADILEEVIVEEPRVVFVMVNGEEVIVGY